MIQSKQLQTVKRTKAVKLKQLLFCFLFRVRAVASVLSVFVLIVKRQNQSENIILDCIPSLLGISYLAFHPDAERTEAEPDFVM